MMVFFLFNKLLDDTRVLLLCTFGISLWFFFSGTVLKFWFQDYANVIQCILYVPVHWNTLCIIGIIFHVRQTLPVKSSGSVVLHGKMFKCNFFKAPFRLSISSWIWLSCSLNTWELYIFVEFSHSGKKLLEITSFYPSVVRSSICSEPFSFPRLVTCTFFFTDE